MKKTYDRIAEIRDTASAINPGDVVWVGGTEGAANEFLSALAERRNELRGVTLLVVTGSEPNKYLEQLRHCGNVRVLSFYRDAITETYRTGDKREFLTSPATKAIDLICRLLLRPGDTIVAVGRPRAFDIMSQALFYDHTVEYLATGVQVPDTWIGRALMRRAHRGPADAGAGSAQD